MLRKQNELTARLQDAVKRAALEKPRKNSASRPRRNITEGRRKRTLCPVPLCTSNVINIYRHLRLTHRSLTEEEVDLMVKVARGDANEAGPSSTQTPPPQITQTPPPQSPTAPSDCSDDENTTSREVQRMSAPLLKRFAQTLCRPILESTQGNPIYTCNICSKVSIIMLIYNMI